MTPEEKDHLGAVYKQMQVGYAKAERDRAIRIRNTDPATALQSLRPAFQMAASIRPLRPSSGLIQYDEALKKVQDRSRAGSG